MENNLNAKVCDFKRIVSQVESGLFLVIDKRVTPEDRHYFSDDSPPPFNVMLEQSHKTDRLGENVGREFGDE